MRVSNQISQQIGLRTMADQEARMLHTMQQLGSGRRVLTPADDPMAASQAVTVAQTASINTRLGANRDIAMRNLTTQEQVLGEVTTMLTGVLTRVVEAGNGTYSDNELKVLANELRETRESLLGQANATDGNGQYLFSGNRGDLAPYDAAGRLSDPPPSGARSVQVSQTRQMSSGDLATDVFGRVSPGATGYYGETGSPYAGAVTFGSVQTVDVKAAGYGAQLSVTFTERAGGGFDITVRDVAADPADPAAYGPAEYTSGQTLSFNGVRVAFSGEPADGDTLTLQPTASAQIDLFDTLDNLIAALETGSTTATDKAALSNALATANRKLNLHLDNVLTVRASGGARMNEIDALQDDGDNRKLNYDAQLMSLEEVDIREASSQLASYRVGLEAAQLAFMKIQGLSLFSRG
ncbi:flagellar hook-associated protein FlgL [Achromobacter sp. GG226]|uniref:flagellar hook-associated protein FlgL n=1 Tax=Verticiella alkaliphila TaxID=2779529 RepID=UPI001C0E39A2|nr:flagellar hook-associated protein FlgL [Verticiella sp. GG226]MBU4610496.1 flagellar hook-associated protein FlgL [Verticiella sp. GG226]